MYHYNEITPKIDDLCAHYVWRSHTCAAVGTLAEEGSYAVVAGRTVVTSCTGTVINVLAAVVSRPPIDADAVIAAMRVVARPPVLARVGHQLALVHIFCAVLT